VNQKKSSRPWSFRIKDILDAVEKIQKFTESMTFAEFDKNTMALDAVIRNFEIIGEAGNHIPISIQNQYPRVPWRQIISMRNSLIHDYFGADNRVIWDTIQIHLADLKSQLLLIVADYPNEQGF
jgi:uncharacterized protein with HEPN domain